MDSVANKRVYRFISVSIIEVLGNFNFEEEMVEAFSIYLKISLLKTYTRRLKIKINKLYCSVTFSSLGIHKNQISIWIQENKPVIMEMYDEVCKMPISLQWLKDWNVLCNEILVKDNYNIETLQQLDTIINDQLEISELGAYMQACLILDVLNY